MVHWSIDDQSATPYVAGSTYTGLDADTNVRSESSLVVVEMDHQYVSAVGGRIFTAPFDFSQKAKRWPRKSSRVQLCQTADPANCTS